MEEGVEILAWDGIKSRWSGAGIDASHPKQDYHRWVTLQPLPPILPRRKAMIEAGTFPHLARRIEEHWSLKLEDLITGPRWFLPSCLKCVGRWLPYDESHELALLEWRQRKAGSPADASMGDIQTRALL